MTRDDVLNIRFNGHESELIRLLAEHLERDESDAVRFLIRRAARELLVDNSPAEGGDALVVQNPVGPPGAASDPRVKGPVENVERRPI